MNFFSNYWLDKLVFVLLIWIEFRPFNYLERDLRIFVVYLAHLEEAAVVSSFLRADRLLSQLLGEGFFKRQLRVVIDSQKVLLQILACLLTV